MFDLFKYEFKYTKSYNIFTLIALILTVISVAFNFNIAFGILNSTTSILVNTVLFIVSILCCIKIFSRYLYNNDGYLLFTLPKSGYEITGSRLLFSFIAITVSLILLIFSSLFIGYKALMYGAPQILEKLNISSLISSFLTPSVVIYGIFDYTFSILVFIMIIYFSMIVGKTVMSVRKYEKGIAFVIFIATIFIIGSIRSLISNIWVINSYVNVAKFEKILNSIQYVNVNLSNTYVSFDILQLIFNIVIFTALFIGTSKLIDTGVEK